MVKIIDEQVSGLPTIKWANGKPTMIVLHDTANPNSTASGERNYMANNYRNAFYHMLADHNGMHVFHDPSKGGAWGAGPSMHNYAIHIELLHAKNQKEFDAGYKNYVDGAIHYAKKYGIPIKLNSGKNKKGLVTHNYVTKTWGGTTHTDPDAYLNKWGVSISQLAKDLGASTRKASSGGSSNSSKGSSKSISTMASEVIAGKHGSGHANRRKSLGIGQAQYDKVRAEVNKRADGSSKKTSGKSIATMAKEVIAGKHGSGHANRQKSLGISKSQYEKVRAEVNKQSGGGSSSKSSSKSISTMATEVLNGQHGSGHANRRKSLGISQAQYNKVRAEVNKRAGGGSAKSSGKSVSQMASEIINGKGIPNGHEARRKHFGISKAQYEKVRKEVNRRL